MDVHFYPLGDNAVTVELGNSININTHKKVRQLSAFLDKNPPEWMIEYIPAFATVTLYYNPVYVWNHSKPSNTLPYEQVCQELQTLLTRVQTTDPSEPRTIEIPVHYGGQYGPDLSFVSKHNNITEEQVIEYHSNKDYLVYMIGFAPGFPYIGGMDERIAAPRKKEPRTTIPAGSVGIAGKQTGVYPIETPGGWQLIGRTPLTLFNPDGQSPSLLQAGDHIRFKSISEEEYLSIKEDET